MFGIFRKKPSLDELTQFNRMLASDNCTEQEVASFLKRKPDVNQQDHNGSTTLNCAFYLGKDRIDSVVRRLIKYGADPNLQDKDGSTALHEACRARCWCSPSTVSLLLEKNAATFVKDWTGSLPEELAATKSERNHRDAIVKLFN